MFFSPSLFGRRTAQTVSWHKRPIVNRHLQTFSSLTSATTESLYEVRCGPRQLCAWSVTLKGPYVIAWPLWRGQYTSSVCTQSRRQIDKHAKQTHSQECTRAHTHTHTHIYSRTHSNTHTGCCANTGITVFVWLLVSISYNRPCLTWNQ